MIDESTKISLGTGIKFVSGIVCIIVGWVAVDNRLVALETTVANADLAQIPITLGQIDVRLAGIEKQLSEDRKDAPK